MQDYREYFKGKKITLMGLGLLGRGVGDAAFLAECGAIVTVTDKKTAAKLAESVAKIERYPNILFHLGGHLLEDFTTADLVIKAAGVPLDAPEIAAATKAGVQVMMSTALFAKFAREAGAKIVGVTGTRGKSTVTQMIAHSLISAAAKAPADRRANIIVGGNVRGVSTLTMLPELYKGYPCIIVLELDSWQLQGFGDLEISPNVAVFTNFMPDHQNYYPDMDAYFADKVNIFKYQEDEDVLIVGRSVLKEVSAARPAAAPHVPPTIPADWQLNVICEHNRENAAFAAAALRALGLSEREIKSGLESFQPVEGRLQFVREVHGVKIYNDNNATTPEATIAALKAFDVGFTKSHISLICGGSEKGLDLKALIAEIQERASQVIVLTDANYKGSERLMGELKTAGLAFEEASSLEEAVEKGMKGRNGGNGGKGNGTLLFSPAFASFGMFKNEYDRNDLFLRLISELRER